MDFYTYINRYELELKKKYYNTVKERQRFEQEIDSINHEIRKMRSLFRKPAPIGLTAGLAGGNMFGMLFALMFQSSLWVVYLVLFAIFTALGIANETYERAWKEDMDCLYKTLRESHRDKHTKEVVESRITSMLNDIHQCYQYYFYMVKDEDKKREITIDLQEVYDSQCKLSTFLHELFNGDLERFRNLHPYQQIREEHELRVGQKVREAKAEKLGFEEPIERPRRRMANRYYNEYVVAGNNALKR